MPTYRFECPKCGEFENVLGMSDGPPWDCPACHGPNVRKLIARLAGIKMPAESSPRYEQWFRSEETQAKLRRGEFEIARKSDDINHW